MRAKYLADISAWEWAGAVKEHWYKLVTEGQIATCSIVDLEVLFSARSSKDWQSVWKMRSQLELAEITQATVARAVEVQGLLSKVTELGHRSADLPDLIVAATAEAAGLTVLHYDQDFNEIAAITAQPCEWLAPKGSLKR